MKKLLGFIIIVAMLLTLAACGVELEYYINTSVPTFTCVTGITGSRTSTDEFDLYTYSCDENKKTSLTDKYISYLKDECGFVTVSSDDGYGFITLAKDGWGVIVDATAESTINIAPYKRAN